MLNGVADSRESSSLSELSHPKQNIMYYKINVVHTVRNFPSAAVSGGDFWRAAKTGGRRCTPVNFGRQPAQVFSRPCRRTQSVLTQRSNF